MRQRITLSRGTTIGIVAGTAATITVGVTIGLAWAATTDNMYPTAERNTICRVDPDGGDGTINCQTDNAYVAYWSDTAPAYALEYGERTIVNNVAREEYDETDLTMAYDSTPVFSGTAETDIIYQESNLNISSSADGVTWCNSVGRDEFDCDQQYIRIRPGHYNSGLVCHETGHAVGLLHGSSAYPRRSNSDTLLGCMTTPTIRNTLGANNIEMINSTY